MHYCTKNNIIKLFYIIFYKTEDWEWSVVLSIPKKGNTKECSNYCTTLISYANKAMLKILQDRLQQYLNQELPNVQAGCRKGRGTRYQISNIHWIIEKARELQKNINFCFTDYAKAFHCVDHMLLISSIVSSSSNFFISMKNCSILEAQAQILEFLINSSPC